jgi:hypothetical protein
MYLSKYSFVCPRDIATLYPVGLPLFVISGKLFLLKTLGVVGSFESFTRAFMSKDSGD